MSDYPRLSFSGGGKVSVKVEDIVRSESFKRQCKGLEAMRAQTSLEPLKENHGPADNT